MPTIIEKTIGTGGDYADWDAFLAAAPADLVALDQMWLVKFKNQVHLRSTPFVFANKTTDATRYFEFTTDTGAAWYENINIRNLPYGLFTSRGATLQQTGTIYGFQNTVNYTKFRGLQFLCSNTGNSTGPGLHITSTVLGCEVDRCICDSYGTHSSVPAAMWVTGSTNKVRNCLVILRGGLATSNIANFNSGCKVYNTLCVSLNVKVNVGIATNNAAPTFDNVGVFNATAPEGTPAATKRTCATDSATSGWIQVPFSTATFNSITAASPDFRLAAGSALINAGTTTSEAVTDATGQARVGATDIGPWEYSVADTIAPNLTSPAASAASATAASGSVATDEAGGTLYFLVNTSPTATAAAVIASGATFVVNSTGAQTTNASGLTAGTTYYGHFVQVDAAGNTSAVVSTTSFATPAVDAVAPTFAGGGAITPGTITSSSLSGSYPAATDNVGVAYYEKSKDGGATWENNGSGLTFNYAGLASGTTFPIGIRAVDAAGNPSAALSLSMTTASAPTGSFKSSPLSNGAESAWPAGTEVVWEWLQGGRIGSAPISTTRGAGVLASDRTITATGCPTGAGVLLVGKRGATVAADDVYLEVGTVA